MTRYQFTARLLANAVISERSTTTGGHRCLDHIPGSCLLGAAAARIYKHLGDDAYTVFHSGRVRFGNAYPLSAAGEPSLPVPFAWHAGKGEELNGSVAAVKNLLHATKAQHDVWETAGEQQKQLRDGFFTMSGSYLKPTRQYRLKTAIDRDRMGMASEAQLFGYESLSAGTCWSFTVDFDDALPEKVRQQVVNALTGRLRIGRSRSAEYGLFDVAVPQPVATSEPEAASGGEAIIYCLSDLALADTNGTPTLVPAPEHFDLAGAAFDAGRSFLRVRGYAPFNSTRKRFDLERQVITKGSVLVFTGVSSDALATIRQKCRDGIGLHRQEGLGQILINPSFLGDFDFRPMPVAALTLPERTAAVPPAGPLTDWLLSRAGEREQACRTIETVETWIKELVKGACPKNSQWGQLRTIAFQESGIEAMRQRIQKLCSDGVSQKQWSKTVRIEGKKTEYGKFLLETVLKDGTTLEVARQRLYHLGNRVPRRNNQQEQRGDA